MADRIIPRHDTMARWAEVNPILMEGEWGIVTDSPSLYKVGDGLTAWNDLPFRGYDGTIVQNEGNSTRSVMSQNAVTTRLASANANIAELQTGVAARYTKQEVDAKEKKLREDVDAEYAKKDGAYPKFTAGFAENIVGDGSATPEVFSFRPTAGEERNVENTTILYDGAKNGEAKIKVLKGNSVVHNQLSTQPQSSFTITATNNEKFRYIETRATIPVGTKCFVIANYEASENTVCSEIGVGLSNYSSFNGRIKWIYFTEQKGVLSGIVESLNSANNTIILRAVGLTNGSIKFSNVRCVNLTKKFGAGKEPTTVEEFWQRLLIGVDLNTYNAGEIVDGNYGALKTTGYNQFNGTYAKVLGGVKYYLGGTFTSIGFASEQGGTTEAIEIPSDKYYTPSQNGYIYASGAEICISFAWSEYADMQGTYLPYKSFERDLSWVSKYFPNGMRSAGSARDEIRFNSTTQKWEAVQRIGVVDLGSLKWEWFNSFKCYSSSDLTSVTIPTPSEDLPNLLSSLASTLTYKIFSDSTLIEQYSKAISVNTYKTLFLRDRSFTDGDVESFKNGIRDIILYYEMAKPIVTEIEENINMDFDCADYGTEESIVAEGEKSAPLSADIIYQPNAVKTLGQVPDILRRLNALESAFAQQTTNVEPSNVEE